MDEGHINTKFAVFCLSGIAANTAYYLHILNKQKRTIADLAKYGGEVIRVAEEGRFILDKVMECAIMSVEDAARINDDITLYKHDWEMMQVPGIAEKTSLLMRSSPHIQGENMTDQTPETTPEVPVQPSEPAPKPSRLRQFTANHPKIVNAAKLTAAAVGIVAVTRAVTNAQHNREQVQAGLDQTKEGLETLSDSVTSTTED